MKTFIALFGLFALAAAQVTFLSLSLIQFRYNNSKSILKGT